MNTDQEPAPSNLAVIRHGRSEVTGHIRPLYRASSGT
jgi:hypothetical protein